MPDPTLQTTALRYAARDLPPPEAAAFEGRLAADQDARDALGEAVRLSAAALGRAPPSPRRSFRAAVRGRLAGGCPPWLARRAYRGHPLAWAGAGAAAVAACTLLGLALTDPGPAPPADRGVAAAPPGAAFDPVAAPALPGSEALVTVDEPACGGDGPSVAELWAQMSGAETVEKAHEDEMRWRQRIRDAATFPARAGSDDRDP